MSVLQTRFALDSQCYTHSISKHTNVAKVLCKALACTVSGYAGYRLGLYFVSPISTVDLTSEPEDVLQFDEGSGDRSDRADGEEIADGDLSAIQAGAWEPCKLVRSTLFHMVLRSEAFLR